MVSGTYLTEQSLVAHGAYFAFCQLEFSEFECDYCQTEKESDVAILLLSTYKQKDYKIHSNRCFSVANKYSDKL